MTEQQKQKILKAIDEVDFGEVKVIKKAGKVVGLTVQLAMDLHENELDKS